MERVEIGAGDGLSDFRGHNVAHISDEVFNVEDLFFFFLRVRNGDTRG